MNIIAGIMVGLSAVFIYLLPTYIAIRRGHKKSATLYLLNLFLGWTVLGWVAVLVWSCLHKVDINEKGDRIEK